MMSQIHKMWAVGLMSGTAIDGTDAALVETDGIDVFAVGDTITRHYDEPLKELLRGLLGCKPEDNIERWKKAELLFTLFTKETVLELLEKAAKTPEEVEVVGFHGHTVLHNVEQKITRQIGDAQLLANELKIPVVSRFRNVDIKAGGTGAPMEAAYLNALAVDMEKPVGIINIGGVTNITIIGQNGEMQAFHTGAGDALIDDWVRKRYGVEMDFDGLLAAKGKPDMRVVADLLLNPFFAKVPPKAIDRDYFSYALHEVDGLSAPDGAATLTAFVAAGIKKSVDDFALVKPLHWVVFGGGANNLSLVKEIEKALGSQVVKADEAGLKGNTLEAQSFAFLAVRSLFGLPITFPETTGAPEPLSGGKLFMPEGGADAG